MSRSPDGFRDGAGPAAPASGRILSRRLSCGTVFLAVLAAAWSAAAPTALAQTISGTFAGPILSGGTATLVNGASIVGDVTNAGTLEFSLSGSSLTVSDPYVISGAGQVLLTSTSSTITFANSNTYTGLTTLNRGLLRLNNADALGGGGAVTFGGGRLRYSASNTSDLSSRIVSSGSAISIELASQAVTFASGLAATNTGGLRLLGTGTLTLAGSNAYTGLTTVVGGGNLQLGDGGTTGSILGDVDMDSSGSLYFNRSDAVTYAGVVSGRGKVYKRGAGSLTLSGTSTHTGFTQVDAGSLYVDGQLGAGFMEVDFGTLLGGEGKILGRVTFTSGTLAPGSLSSPLATLTVGNLVMSGSTTTVMTISGSSVGQYDQVAAATGTTSLTLAGILDLTMTGTAAGGSYDYANLTTFHLFSGFARSGTSNFSSVVLHAAGTRYDGLAFTFQDGVYKTGWTPQSVGQYLVFDAATGDLLVVPEPGTLALAGMAVACIVGAARWRRLNGRRSTATDTADAGTFNERLTIV